MFDTSHWRPDPSFPRRQRRGSWPPPGPTAVPVDVGCSWSEPGGGSRLAVPRHRGPPGASAPATLGHAPGAAAGPALPARGEAPQRRGCAKGSRHRHKTGTFFKDTTFVWGFCSYWSRKGKQTWTTQPHLCHPPPPPPQPHIKAEGSTRSTRTASDASAMATRAMATPAMLRPGTSTTLSQSSLGPSAQCLLFPTRHARNVFPVKEF